MKKYILIIQLMICSQVFAQCTFEKFSPFYSNIARMLLLKDGGYLTYATVTYPETKLVLIKTDSCGNTSWTNDIGYLGAGDPNIVALEMDSGNIMVVGYTSTSQTTRIGKYTQNGQLVKEQFLKQNWGDYISGAVRNYVTGSYLLFGSTDYALPRALITEIDENLNIIRRKEFTYSELSGSSSNLNPAKIDFLLHLNSNQYYCTINMGTNNPDKGFLIELDSGFNVKKRRMLPIDTLYAFGFHTMLLNKDQKHFDASGSLKENENNGVDFVLRMDLDGNIEKITHFTEYLPYMSPTLDGGYITGAQLIKVDSNLSEEWRKPTNDSYFFNVFQLTDSSYVCGGISMARNKPMGFELYLVKMDKNGNYIKTGLNEKNRQLSNDLVVYPNPSNNGIFNIKTTHQPYQTVTIHNTTGQLVYTSTNAVAMVDLSSQANGLYYLTFQNENGNNMCHQKIMVQR